MSSTQFHSQQLDMRLAEIEEVSRTLVSINNGSGADVYKKNARREGYDLSSWKNRLALDRLIIGGHSFGSNTVVSSI